MAIHSLNVTFHIRTDRAADGEAGVLMPLFLTDLAMACRYREVDLPDDPEQRRATLTQRFADLVRSMPARIRRGFDVVLESDTESDRPKPSRWNPETGGWDPDTEGTGVILQLQQDGTLTLPFGKVDARGLSRFQVAVEAKVV